MSINPSVRGFLILIAIAAAITLLGAEAELGILLALLRIAFLIAIAIAVYGFWRSRREDIATWSVRSRAVFYGGAALIVANLAASFLLPYPRGGLEALVFFGVFFAAGFAMWRAWRDEHTYGY